jgi:hypothetical protein
MSTVHVWPASDQDRPIINSSDYFSTANIPNIWLHCTTETNDEYYEPTSKLNCPTFGIPSAEDMIKNK